mmetsp:Transcript_23387/g.51207  ORF Transcript_23387/g.51207 Transcript_23387/m.51207 type:complete len:571 (+) Transcript_23387:1138-2850(+)
MPFFSAHHKDRVFLVVAQVLDGVDHFGRGFGMVAAGLDHAETGQVVQVFVGGNGSSVIEQNQAVVGHFVALGHGLEIQRLETNVHSQQTESQTQTGSGILDGIDALVDPLEIQHDRQGPPLGGNPGHEFAGAGDSPQAFLFRHGQGLLEGLGNLGNLPGVHVKGSAHHSGARGKLAEDDQSPAAPPIGLANGRVQGLLVGNGELEGNKIETVPNRRHEAHVRGLHQRHALLQAHPPVGCFLELDGARPHFVDPLYLIRDLVLGLEVIVPAFPRRDTDLDQDDLADPFGASLEKAFHGQQLEGDPLEALQPIDGAEQGLSGMSGANHGGLPRHAVVPQYLVEDGGFDSGVDAGHGHVPPVGIDGERVAAVSGSVGDHSVVEPQQAAAAGEKMAGVLKQVESDLVGVEHAAQEILAAPEGSEYFRAGKGRVQKDSDLGHGDSSGQVGGQDEQMESVDPDQIPLVETLDDDFGELAVDLVVGGPQFLLATAAAVNGSLFDVVAADLGELLPVLVGVPDAGIRVVFGGVRGVDGGDVVQDRPQDALAESIVHFTKYQGIDPDRDTMKGPQAFLH